MHMLDPRGSGKKIKNSKVGALSRTRFMWEGPSHPPQVHDEEEEGR